MQPRKIRLSSNLLFALVLAVASAALYWGVLRFPFIQDDWDLLLNFQNPDSGAILGSFFSIGGKLFYRPLGQLYLYAMYQVFGPQPLPFHLAALGIHLLNSLLVTGIIRRITRDDWVARAAGLLYALAISIHLEPLLWAVGIYDLGGAFFFLLGIWLFLRNRPIWSAVAGLAAVLFKETTIVLPIILLAYTVLDEAPRGLRPMLKKHRFTFLPYLPLLGLFLFIKKGASPLSLPENHPYALGLWGSHVPRNLYSYCAWMLQSVFPFWNVRSLPFEVLFGVATLLVLVALWIAWRNRRQSERLRTLLFLLLWIALVVLPVVFLRRHYYRYYMVYALPAFVAGLALVGDTLLSAFHLPPPRRIAALGVVVALVAVSAVFQVNIALGEGLNQVTFADGSNGLVKRAATVEIVRGGLLQHLTRPPENAAIVLGGVDLWAFGGSVGPRVWYKDGSIQVYDLENLESDSTGFYIDNPIADQTQTYTGAQQERIPLDPARTFIFRLAGAELVPVRFDELK